MLIGLGIVTILSIALGMLKYGSIAHEYKGKVWQLKAIELWNDVLNFFLTGLVGLYFILVRVPKLFSGESLQFGDFILFLIFLLGIFGHLCVLSKNVTDGIEVILNRALDK